MEFFKLIRQQLFFQCHSIINEKRILIILALLLSTYVSSQVPPPPCSANGNSGFGGAVGEGHFFFSGDGSNPIMFGMSTSANEMNDILVLYIDTGASGRNEIGETVDDNSDDHSIAISNSNAFGNASNIKFPVGFEASYAVAINVDFGGLWSIPSTGTIASGGLDFITSVNSTLTSNDQGFYSFNFSWEDIGLNTSDEFHFVGIYVSNTACSSDEGYGEGLTTVSDCKDDIVFTGYLSLPGCSETLSNTVNTSNNINANYYKDQLFVKGIHEIATISVYDILGKELYRESHQIQESVAIPLVLNKNELQFIVIESVNRKKVLKVIPN